MTVSPATSIPVKNRDSQQCGKCEVHDSARNVKRLCARRIKLDRSSPPSSRVSRWVTNTRCGIIGSGCASGNVPRLRRPPLSRNPISRVMFHTFIMPSNNSIFGRRERQRSRSTTATTDSQRGSYEALPRAREFRERPATPLINQSID